MSIEEIILFLFLALIAEILGTVGGFGSSIFFVPLAATFMEFHEVLGLTAIFHVSSNVSKIALFRKGVDKRIVMLLGIPAIAAVIGGAYLTRFIDTSGFELGLGFLLVLLSSVLLFKPEKKLKASPTNAVVGGVLSGGLAGLLGTGGAIRGITLTAFGLSKDVFIATSAVIDLGVDFSRSIVYASSGYLTKQAWILLPFLFVLSFVGTFIGKQVLSSISQDKFRNIVLMLVLAIGIYMIVRFIALKY